MYKVAAIYGGPRRNNNTEKLLDVFIKGLNLEISGTEKIILKDLEISPCISCYGCGKGGGCIIADDMTGLYNRLREADVIILASPVYFAGVSALAKSMIDRCQAFWSEKYIANIRKNIKKKRGYFIATAGSADNDAFLHAKATVKLFFAACDAEYCGDILGGNTDNLPVEGNEELLKEAFNAGKAAGRELIIGVSPAEKNIENKC